MSPRRGDVARHEGLPTHIFQDSSNGGRIRQVTVVEGEREAGHVRIMIKVVDPVRIQRVRPPGRHRVLHILFRAGIRPGRSRPGL